MIPIARPQMGEEEKELVWSALSSGSLAQGPRVRELEERFAEFVGVPHAIATSSGTTALHLALMAAGVGDGDEVITVPFTFIASANSVLYTGARPVFVDVDETTFNMQVDQIEAAITPRTRAIMPVSLYGQPADMPAIAEIAERRGLAVVEDAAQSHGAAIGDRLSGSWGAGCFSFYPTKNMTTGEGGMVTTLGCGSGGPGAAHQEHGARVRYHHEIVGYNFRMTDIHASIGLAQLTKLPANNARRRQIAGRYDAELRGVITPRARRDTSTTSTRCGCTAATSSWSSSASAASGPASTTRSRCTARSRSSPWATASSTSRWRSASARRSYRSPFTRRSARTRWSR